MAKGNKIKLNFLHLNSVPLNGSKEVQRGSASGGGSIVPIPPSIPTFILTAGVANGVVTATLDGKAISLPYKAYKGDEIVLSVTPNDGYEFEGWSDGNKSNPRTIVVNEDITLNASCKEVFVPLPTYTLSASVSNGVVSATLNGRAISLPYEANEGDVIVVEVAPNEGYTFEGWADGNTDNPRTITMNADVALSAECSVVEMWYVDEANIIQSLGVIPVTKANPHYAGFNPNVEFEGKTINAIKFYANTAGTISICVGNSYSDTAYDVVRTIMVESEDVGNWVTKTIEDYAVPQGKKLWVGKPSDSGAFGYIDKNHIPSDYNHTLGAFYVNCGKSGAAKNNSSKETLCLSIGYVAVIEKPEEKPMYELLKGIYSTSNSSYINSQEPIDSHSNYDLFFGMYGVPKNENTPLFGIRRQSGVGDAYANAFYFHSGSSWRSYAWVYGGTDTSNIDASCYGVPFKGNMHKLSQRRNNIYEWDRLIYHLDKDFNNTDGIPAFIGSLAKTSSTPYNNTASNMIFYRFVVLDDEGVITKDLMPARRTSDGKLGVIDVVDNTFIAAIGTWAEYKEADISTITLEAQVALGTPVPSGTLQSTNYYKGYWVSCHDGQKDFTITKGNIVNNGTTLIYPSQQVLNCAEANSNWHGNSSWLSSEKWSDDDFFPLLYVSTDRDNKLLAVYRIKGSNPDALEGIELVQKITIESSLFFNNFYGLAGANTFVHYGYTQNSYSSADNGNTILLRVYPVPNPKQGNVFLTESDALSDSFDIGFASAGGDGYWSGEFFGMPFQTNNGEYKIYQVSNDSKSMELVYQITELLKYSSSNYLSSAEIETIKFSNYANKWLFANEPINSGRLNFIDYPLLNQYTAIKLW